MSTAGEGPLFHYVIVRADLPSGMQSVQILHAAAQSAHGLHNDGTHAATLIARDELHLALEAERLEHAGVAFVRIHEDRAPYKGALMAIGLVPRAKEALRRHLSSLPLLR